MHFYLIGLVTAAAVSLSVLACENDRTSATSANMDQTDLITAATKNGAKLNCFTDDHQARFSFNNQNDDLVRIERYDPQSAQDINESFVERLGAGTSENGSTSFQLSNGIEGQVTMLTSGVCTDPNTNERYQINLKVNNWGEVSDSGYSNIGCCQIVN